MVESLLINHVGHRGEGVTAVDGQRIYVPYALAGEQVTVETEDGHPDRRRLLSVERASPERIAPFCFYFSTCGGCAIQHWQTSAYQNWKRQGVIDTLAQAGLDCPVDALIDAHGDGRRRITAHARRDRDGTLRTGFAAAGSHDIVPIAQCPILDPALESAFDIARMLAEALGAIGKPLDIQMTATDNGIDVDVRGSGPLSANLMAELSALTARHGVARLTRHGELVILHHPPNVRMGKAEVTLPPGSFLQATQAGEDKLAARIAAHCKGAKHIADLFCGVGPFSLRLAEQARVFASDSDDNAIAALQKAAPRTPGLKPVTAMARDLFRRPLVPQELRDYDAVVFDPPRQGAQAQVKQLAASKVPLIVAVSCNVATFARDARLLIDGGYRCESVTPVDQFRHSAHVELVACFRR